MDIFELLHFIKQKALRIENEDFQIELLYDLQWIHNALLNWMKHTIRDVQQTNAKIFANISTYHSAEAKDTGLKVWQYFGIGPGKDISLNEEAVLSSGYNVLSKFSSSQQHTLNNAFSVKPKRPRLDKEYAANYFCSDQNCMSSFHTDEQIQQHIYSGQHNYPKIVTSYDKIKQSFINIVKFNENILSGILSEGWAFPTRKNVSFSNKQKEFVLENFNFGETTGQKQTPEQVQHAMKMKKQEGKKRFSPEEYFSEV
ncbi:hypothetical protein AVEN_73528-1 [Araneus ventricosus]|uniref:C2H2-type domain-containing protein n=1 Tax=Araneus ventricosus TaxID=182803 RepID=A0A4Y2R622_ARAVE|nr:hypothetical protein AVEN_73528-1 [Araneus ventricosus]